MKKVLSVCCFLFLIGFLTAQKVPDASVHFTAEDSIRGGQYFATSKAWQVLPFGDLIVETARSFTGTPYVASTLEREPEQLVINLRAFDCTTFVENVLALAQTSRHDSLPSFRSFCERLQTVRYRNGIIGDYTDRLHYMSDWIYENERKGLVRNQTGEAGGVPWKLNLSFMSTHIDRYKPLKTQPALLEKLTAIEKTVSARSHTFLPKSEIERHQHLFRNGDIICFVADIKGLDVTHVGIVYRHAGKVSFIHASSTAKKVIIQEDTLAAYVGQSAHCIGILLARPLAP